MICKEPIKLIAFPESWEESYKYWYTVFLSGLFQYGKDQLRYARQSLPIGLKIIKEIVDSDCVFNDYPFMNNHLAT